MSVRRRWPGRLRWRGGFVRESEAKHRLHTIPSTRRARAGHDAGASQQHNRALKSAEIKDRLSRLAHEAYVAYSPGPTQPTPMRLRRHREPSFVDLRLMPRRVYRHASCPGERAEAVTIAAGRRQRCAAHRRELSSKSTLGIFNDAKSCRDAEYLKSIDRRFRP